MDRVAFLRSLPYLRQLDPEMWTTAVTGSGNDESQEVYSGSTVTPPTPSKNKSLLLFEEPTVVSIEPKSCHQKIHNSNTTNNENAQCDKIETIDAPTMSRKRRRADNESDERINSNHGIPAPAFFQQYNSDIGETTIGKSNETDGPSINNDPALSAFEAAIIRQENCNDDDDRSITRSWLLFRFGGRFVYLVDTNAIVTITYEPCSDDDSEKSTDAIKSPPMKRQKSENTKDDNAQAGAPTTIKTPASLVLAFPFCSFRMFSLPNKSNDETPQEGTNGTRSFLLNKNALVEEKLLKARSTLLKRFALDESRSTSQELMSPRLSATIRPGGEEETTMVNSSIPLFLQSKSHNFLNEDWSFCLDVKLPSASPQKNGIPSKVEGSKSSNDAFSSFENGQKIDAPADHSLQTSTPNERVDASERKEGEATKEDDNYERDEKGTDSEIKEDNDDHVGDEIISLRKEKEVTDIGATSDVVGQSWKHDLLNKRCNFDGSWYALQSAMRNKISQTTQANEDGSISHLTRAAQFLSLSYLTPEEALDMSLQSENDIETATKGIENEIESIFPGRGSRKPAGNYADLGNFKERIEYLLHQRKESVDSKLALLFTPKR